MSRDVDATIYAFFAPDFDSDGPVTGTVDDLAAIVAPFEATGPTRVRDARQLQSQSALPADRFFDEYGFALLDHESAVEDWDVDPSPVYHAEAAALIREQLLPGRRLEIYQGPPTRRGPGTPSPEYATGVHQDFGIGPDAYEEGLRAFTGAEISSGWRQRLERDDVEGFLTVNLWRPVYLDGPLRHMPLAVCEPRSVRREDCVPLRLSGVPGADQPTNQLGLRRAPGQRWHYYPDMTRDEVLAFKIFQFYKDEDSGRFDACFHSAFEDPATPPGTPPRQSCEHRVSVYVLKD